MKSLLTKTKKKKTCVFGQALKSGWWFGTFYIFAYIGNFIIPIDSYFSEG